MRITILTFLAFITIEANSQLLIDAGKDSIICCCKTETITIGGNPTATGGQEPYSFNWSGKMLIATLPDTLYLFASEILDDTTKSNPTVLIEKLPEEWFTFELQVKDATGEIKIDSLKLMQSVIWRHNVYKSPFTIKKGDSVKFFGHLFSDINKFQPLTFKITPSLGLADSTDVFGWAKPEKSTIYLIQATNTVGCSTPFSYYWQINIDTVTSIGVIDKSKIKCYLENNKLQVQVPFGFPGLWELTLVSATGQVIYRQKHREKSVIVKNLDLSANQLYIATIYIDDKRYVYKLFR